MPGYERYVPRYEYMVIDVGELDRRWLMDFEGALSKVLLIDGSDAGQIKDVLEVLPEKVERLPREKRDKLVELLHTILVGIGIAEEGGEELLKVGEVDGMLSRLVKSLREEGRMEAVLEDIIDVLEERFGEVPEGIKEELLKVEDLKKLKLLHRKSVSVESVEEFREILREIRR